LGSDENLQVVKGLFNHSKINIIYHSNDTSIYERKCLSLLREHATRENFKALYIHSKGVSKIGKRENNISDWTDLMSYFTIEKHERCLEILQEYDCCGVNIHTVTKIDIKHISNINIKDHFSGNFWWATSEHLRKLPSVIGPKYLDPEVWIGSSPSKMYSFWQSGICHYTRSYPRNLYYGKEQVFIKK
jgi:hypothetical protein